MTLDSSEKVTTTPFDPGVLITNPNMYGDSSQQYILMSNVYIFGILQ